jgi:hypothetical protein
MNKVIQYSKAGIFLISHVALKCQIPTKLHSTTFLPFQAIPLSYGADVSRQKLYSSVNLRTISKIKPAAVEY